MSVARSGLSLIAVLEGSSLPTEADRQEAAVRSILASLRGRDPHLRGLNKCALLLGQSQSGVLQVRFVQDVPDGGWADARGNCGNALAVAAVYAVRKGVLSGDLVRLLSVNTEQEVEVRLARAAVARQQVEIRFLSPAGAISGSLLPTGSVIDTLKVPGEGSMLVSLVDAGNPYVFVEAATLRLEASQMWLAGDSLIARLEAIRGVAMRRLGIPEPSVFPKIAIVASPESGSPGSIAARMISVPSWHPAFALTGMVCLAAAACTTGTVVHRIAVSHLLGPGQILLHHPAGLTAIRAELSPTGQRIKSVSIQQSIELLGEWK